MLMPKRVKFRKQQRGRMTGKAKGGVEVTTGDYGLQAIEPGPPRPGWARAKAQSITGWR